MKKALMILGGIFVGLIIVGGGILAVVLYKSSGLDDESMAYVEEVVPIICSEMKTETFLKYASQEMLQAPRADIERLFFMYEKLGKFMNIDSTTGQARVSYTSHDGNLVCAHYVMNVQFEAGPATIVIDLVKREGKWKILLFNVNSSIYLQSHMKNVESEQEELSEKNGSNKYELARDVGRLIRGDQVQLRRDVSKVFSLAAMREQEGKEAEAITLYEKGLEVNAANIPMQMRLASLLAKQGRSADALARANIVQEFAENEDLVSGAENLLKALGHVPAPSTGEKKGGTRIRIVLVPMGNVNQGVLSSVREKLEERMGMDFTVSSRAKSEGNPDRNGNYPFVKGVFDGLKKAVGDGGFLSLASEMGLRVNAVYSYDEMLKFIYAALEHSGPQGQETKIKFDLELAKSGIEVQYDLGRLLREMRSEFPLQKDSPIQGYLGITDVDLYEGESRYRFGGATPGYGVMSIKRFTSDFTGEDQNRPRLIQRALKQALSSANFVLGIPRCTNPNCVRAYPNSLQELDQKPDVLCSICQERLAAYKDSMRK